MFQNLQDRKRDTAAAKFDFRRPDRIPKSQVRAIHLLHDTFVRNVVSSLSAYLRSYLTVNLVSVEQLSYAEFLDGLPSPTCMVSLGLRPYDGNGVLELNPSLVFPILEMLLGGNGKSSGAIQREITEIEQRLLGAHGAGQEWRRGAQDLSLSALQHRQLCLAAPARKGECPLQLFSEDRVMMRDWYSILSDRATNSATVKTPLRVMLRFTNRLPESFIQCGNFRVLADFDVSCDRLK